MNNKKELEYPRILVVSNNAFSNTNNNGKTLASFFDKYPVDKIAQLYFNSEIPNSGHYDNYFRITDADVLKSLITKENICGGRLSGDVNKENIETQKEKNNLINKIKGHNITRIAREIIWKREKWKTESFKQWLNDFSPEVIFFCAGDSGFAYDITKYIHERFKANLVTYITDDYVLPRKTISPFWWIRRGFILNKMKSTVLRSDLFLTISKEMRDIYKVLLGKDSNLAINMTDSMKDENIAVRDTDIITLVYTGGLHYKRYLTLNLLANSLKKYNENPNNKKKAILKIYSGQEPTSKILQYLTVDGASEFCGKLNPIQLKEVLNTCNFPVHVESFDRKSIESTKLSISTKIPEYLSLGKPVIALGPSQVASMKYLQDCAFCINDKDNISIKLDNLFRDEFLHAELSYKALEKFENNHVKEIVSNNLIKSILENYNNTNMNE